MTFVLCWIALGWLGWSMIQFDTAPMSAIEKLMAILLRIVLSALLGPIMFVIDLVSR